MDFHMFYIVESNWSTVSRNEGFHQLNSCMFSLCSATLLTFNVSEFDDIGLEIGCRLKNKYKLLLSATSTCQNIRLLFMCYKYFPVKVK